MLPEFYQIVLQCHLTQSQYLILHILVLLIQGQRSVQLATLARLFPQPIKYWLREESKPANTDSNRGSRRRALKLSKDQYALVAIDRTQWREKNLFVASLLCKGRGIPLHWQLLPKLGNSNLSEQKRCLTATLRLLKGRSVVIIGDREFHSVGVLKRCLKIAGYNLEQACVNQDCFLALFLLVVLAYGMALFGEASLTHHSLKDYLVRTYKDLPIKTIG